MEMEQFISAKKNAVKARKVKRNSVGCTPQECSPEDPQEINEAGNDSLLPKTFIGYFRYFIFERAASIMIKCTIFNAWVH